MRWISLNVPDHLVEWAERRAEGKNESTSRWVSRLIARDMADTFGRYSQSWQADNRAAPPVHSPDSKSQPPDLD
jgi:hypothetical protein